MAGSLSRWTRLRERVGFPVGCSCSGGCDGSDGGSSRKGGEEGGGARSALSRDVVGRVEDFDESSGASGNALPYALPPGKKIGGRATDGAMRAAFLLVLEVGLLSKPG